MHCSGPDSQVLIYQGAEAEVYMHEDVLNGTQFTCFTGTKVPILTLRVASVSDCTLKDADSSEIHLYCHFTWFEGTKVQILT